MSSSSYSKHVSSFFNNNEDLLMLLDNFFSEKKIDLTPRKLFKRIKTSISIEVKNDQHFSQMNGVYAAEISKFFNGKDCSKRTKFRITREIIRLGLLVKEYEKRSVFTKSQEKSIDNYFSIHDSMYFELSCGEEVGSWNESLGVFVNENENDNDNDNEIQLQASKATEVKTGIGDVDVNMTNENHSTAYKMIPFIRSINSDPEIDEWLAKLSFEIKKLETSS